MEFNVSLLGIVFIVSLGCKKLFEELELSGALEELKLSGSAIGSPASGPSIIAESEIELKISSTLYEDELFGISTTTWLEDDDWLLDKIGEFISLDEELFVLFKLEELFSG